MFTWLVNKSNATGRRAFLQDRFSDKTSSAVGSKFAEDFEFFVLTTLENYHQISHSGPWSANYDFGVITFCN